MKQELVEKYGPFWARNDENFKRLKAEAKGSSGIYLLYCGWFPVYVGQGELVKRITGWRRSKTKVWDRFTWFALADSTYCRELEAILLRSLPFYLRLHNKQGAHLPVRSTKTEHKNPITISLPKMTPRRKRK